jgi:hypothetical protein
MKRRKTFKSAAWMASRTSRRSDLCLSSQRCQLGLCSVRNLYILRESMQEERIDAGPVPVNFDFMSSSLVACFCIAGEEDKRCHHC